VLLPTAAMAAAPSLLFEHLMSLTWPESMVMIATLLKLLELFIGSLPWKLTMPLMVVVMKSFGPLSLGEPPYKIEIVLASWSSGRNLMGLHKSPKLSFELIFFFLG
jgi:hypothetical protein